MSSANRLLLGIAATFVVTGIVEPHLPNPGQFPNEIGVAQIFVLAGLLFAWCKADAASRGVRPPAGAPLLVALFALIGVPYYFFRTRPWRTALLDTGRALGFLAITYALYYGCFYVSARVP